MAARPKPPSHAPGVAVQVIRRRVYRWPEDVAGRVALLVWLPVWLLTLGRMGRPLWYVEEVEVPLTFKPPPPPVPPRNQMIPPRGGTGEVLLEERIKKQLDMEMLKLEKAMRGAPIALTAPGEVACCGGYAPCACHVRARKQGGATCCCGRHLIVRR